MNRALLSLCIVALLGSCNIFNPSGEGESPSNSAEWVEQGNLSLRDRDFVYAEKCYRNAIRRDSSNSSAWRGLTKAISGEYLPVKDVLTSVKPVADSGAVYLWNLSPETKDSWYQAFYRLKPVFEKWYQLDSLSITEMPAYDKADRNTVKVFCEILGLWDTNEDGRINSADIDIGSLFSFTYDLQNRVNLNLDEGELQSLIEEKSGESDSAKIEDLGALLAIASSSVSEINNAVSSDSLSSSFVKDLIGSDSLFSYQPPAALDEDGDGCVDEEVSDGLDNDGDGLIDEDVRSGWRYNSWVVSPGVLSMMALSDSIRGDRLLNPETGAGIAGVDSATTLRYGDSYGHIEMFRRYWDAKDSRYVSLHWKEAPLDSLLARRNKIIAMPWGTDKIILGCELAGGCWCQIKEYFCSGGICRAP
ncbi:MAG: hypothetical protein M0P13_10995 [Fibrobacteraceae bacterium]|nr:hypothetical protein [Fibrobacteraceae bacterium]